MVTIPLWLSLVFAALAALLGVGLAHRLRRRAPEVTVDTALQHARWPWLLVVGLVALVGVHLALQQRSDWWWALPPALERVYLVAVWVSITACLAVLVGYVWRLAALEGHPEARKLVVAGVLLVGAVQFAQHKFTRPLADMLEHRVSQGVVLQTSGATCAAATMANMQRIWGQPTTERAMARLLNTTSMGTATGQVIYAFHALGVVCEKVEVGGPEALALPAMLFIDHPQAGPESHAVALVRRTPGLEVWDPLEGRVAYTAEGLAAVWRGRAVACRAP